MLTVITTTMFVSGLPLNITVEEFVTLMGKCGIIMEDEKGKYDCVNIDKKYVGGKRGGKR